MELKCCVKTSVGTRTYIERSFRKLFFEDLFLILICVCVGIYVHECWYRWNPDKGIGPIGGGVTVIVSYQAWLLGTKLCKEFQRNI